MDNSKVKIESTFKFIIIGDPYVGKSNIIYRFTKNLFSEEYNSTLNLDFTYKNIATNNKIYRAQLWDTAGQQQFQSITRGYFKNSDCAILVYDITIRDTFNNIENWLERCKNDVNNNASFILVGNKEDLKDNRNISYDEGEEFATRNGMLFFETSAKTGKNIEEMFNKAVESIVRKKENIDNNNGKNIKIDNQNPKKKKKCC